MYKNYTQNFKNVFLETIFFKLALVILDKLMNRLASIYSYIFEIYFFIIGISEVKVC